MSNRVYNILFHLHTVSGIVISVLLFVIFFAGSFSFFRDDIVNWERGHTVEQTERIDMDLDAAMDSLSQHYNLHGRDVSISKHYLERRIGVSLSASHDSLASGADKARAFFYLDMKTTETASYASSYSLGEFLYRLHFMAQIPYPVGYYLSGFTALFFLFAIITGILVHWDKIVSNFFLFRPWAKLKAMWTDAHTALGTLGLPFQFVYAVTGAFFMIKALLIAPSIFVLYDGDQKQFYADLGYGEPTFEYSYQPLSSSFSFNDMVRETSQDWAGFDVNHMHIFNYGDSTMHVAVEGEMNRNVKFTGPGKRIYQVATGEVIEEQSPLVAASYMDGVKNWLYRLHYGDYGGYALRIVSFFLGIVSCFVIISGIMIWLVARKKQSIPERKRKFNLWVAQIYMAICLSMFPVTAFTFVAVKLFDGYGKPFIYSVYFLTWLFASVLFIIKRDIGFTNKYCLLSGSLIGLLVPIANGISSGQWIWISWREGADQVLFIDLFWIGLSALAWLAYRNLNKKQGQNTESNVTAIPEGKEESVAELV